MLSTRVVRGGSLPPHPHTCPIPRPQCGLASSPNPHPGTNLVESAPEPRHPEVQAESREAGRRLSPGWPHADHTGRHLLGASLRPIVCEAVSPLHRPVVRRGPTREP